MAGGSTIGNREDKMGRKFVYNKTIGLNPKLQIYNYVLGNVIEDKPEPIVIGRVEYHPKLKIIAYDMTTKEDFGSKRRVGDLAPTRMLEYLMKKSKNNKKKLANLEKDIKCINHFQTIQILFMETFGGYKRI